MKSDSEFFIEALSKLCPNGAGYDGVEIRTVSDPVPTQKEMDTKIAELKAEYDAQAYARNRSYPTIGDQLDALYHAGVFPEEMAAKLKNAKDDNPKP